ncbi:diguanylate cyclase [Serpentinicella alkaliphila]|uniref:Diguanylate cyclase (GGDEF)-like protein n=1 Tax=Serpentinicella alkaliphila TaxID=1734049 RepID=A0A4R2T0K4_9FIRM|nr:diguanylate cyclase [Serpentinicella alkaliphila]QUH26956.1 diguanylate cyclase [Serpentinicella alkaliphila]TCP95405.1 diguanylate cyclase (GGDEF)-like protein [Serpentinicella alkaliphila]
MKLINNRYRILNCIESDSNYSKYIVNDLIKRNEVVFLNIINASDVTRPLIDFCVNNFYNISPCNHPNILSIYTFGIVEHIDDKPCNELKYFYTTEYYENNIIDSMDKPLNNEEILEIYIEIARVLDYLNFNGVIYKFLGLDTLIINKTDGVYSVKLVDLISLQHKALNKQFDDNIALNYLAPEIVSEGGIGEYTDIYSVGIILFYLKTLEKYKPSKLSKKIETCIIDNLKWDLSFYRLIYNLTNSEYRKRPQTIHEVNIKIKEIFSYESEIDDKKYIDNLNFKTPIVGRDLELKEILSSSFNYDEKQNVFLVVVQGYRGIGKTRLLSEVHYKMQLKRIKSIYVSISDDESSFYKIVPKILKQLYKIAPLNILDKYSKELVKLTPEIGSNIAVTPTKELHRDKELLRLYDRVSNFIIEVSQIRPISLALDDFHFSDNSFYKFLEYLVNVNQIKKAPLLIIVAISEDSIKLTESQEFISKCSKYINILNLRLSRLSLEETGQMVNNILGYLRNPIDIATQIYNETEGIPSFIEEILRQLYSQNILYINFNDETQTYEWKINPKIYSEFKLQNNIDEAIVQLINNFSNTKRSLLEIISIFNTSTSIDLIGKMLDLNVDLSTEFYELTKLKILNEKLEDWGYTYGFHSVEVKNYIYNSIDNEKLLLLHKKASDLIEELYKREGRENKDELIFHLLKSNQLDKVIDYCIESGENMFRLRIYSQAIEFYKRAYELVQDKKDYRALEIIMKIGQTYQNLGKNNEAIEAFEEVINISSIIGDKERPIDAKNIIGYIYFLRNDLDKAVDYFKQCIKDAEYINYLEGLLRAAYLLSKTYINTRQILDMDSISVRYLALAHKHNRFDYVGIFLSQKGIAKHIKGYSLEAIEFFNESIEYLEKGEKPQETSGPINSIGLIYLEHFQDVKTARRYFERALSIAQLYHKVEDMVRAYNNITDSYMMDGEYELAVNVLNKNISLSIEYEDEIARFISYVKLVECYINLEEYSKAYSSLIKAQKESKNYLLHSEYNEKFLEISARFYNAMGNYEKVLEILESFNFDQLDIRMKQKVRLIRFIAKANLGLFVYDNELLAIIEAYRKTSYVIDRRVALFTANLYFILNGDFEKSLNIYNEDIELSKVFDNDFFRIRHKFLGALTNNHEEAIDNLELLQTESFNVRHDEIKWLIYYILGNLYLHKKEFFKATNYFLNALDTINRLYSNVPEDFKDNYLLGGGKPLVKQKLLFMESLISDKTQNNSTSQRRNDLSNYFDVSPLKSLIKNPEFYKLALNQYKEQFPLHIDSIEGLISKLSSDTLNNLELTIGLISRNILATSSHIIMKLDNKYDKVVSIGKDIELNEISYMLEKIELSRQPIYINNTDSMENNQKNILYRDAKAIVCLPIFSRDNSECEGIERRKDSDINTILGFLYLESDIVFNNFSTERIEECKKLIPLLSSLLDTYYLKIYSSIDKLTGVYERKFFEKLFKEQVSKATLSNQPFSIIMCDVDHFKKVNDTYGHQKGDKILAEVGSVIKGNIRRTDFAARYGGEEFIILLPNTTKDDAFLVAEKIRKKFKEENLLGRESQLTISCGIASFPQDSTSHEKIIERADQALYKAKDEGRNRSIKWKEGMDFAKNRVDKLAGVITGNVVEDQRNALVLVKAIEMVSSQGTLEDKLYEILGRLIDILEAEEGTVFELEDNMQITNRYCRRRLVEGWIKGLEYNNRLIEKVIDMKQGEYLIDWEDTSSIDVLTGSPNWKSIIIMPIMHNGNIKGIMYFTAFTKYREFDYNSYNLVKLTSGVIAALLT